MLEIREQLFLKYSKNTCRQPHRNHPSRCLAKMINITNCFLENVSWFIVDSFCSFSKAQVFRSAGIFGILAAMYSGPQICERMDRLRQHDGCL